MNESSIDALKNLDARGERQRQHFHIHSFLLAHGPMTSGEYYDMTGANTGKRAISQSRARFTELYYEGRLVKLPRRACRITGQKVTVWKAKLGPYVPVAHPITRKQAIREMNAAIEGLSRVNSKLEESQREVARLQGQVAELKAEVESLTRKRKP